MIKETYLSFDFTQC